MNGYINPITNEYVPGITNVAAGALRTILTEAGKGDYSIKFVAGRCQSGSGKSSTSRAVAERLGAAYLDTGSIYRALATWCASRSIGPDDAPRGLPTPHVSCRSRSTPTRPVSGSVSMAVTSPPSCIPASKSIFRKRNSNIALCRQPPVGARWLYQHQ